VHLVPAETLRQLLPGISGSGNLLSYFVIFSEQYRLRLQEGQVLNLKHCMEAAQAAVREDDKLKAKPGLAPAGACAALDALWGLAVLPNTVRYEKREIMMSRRNLAMNFRFEDGGEHSCEVWEPQLCSTSSNTLGS
jgi:hypothetical protein